MTTAPDLERGRCECGRGGGLAVRMTEGEYRVKTEHEQHR